MSKVANSFDSLVEATRNRAKFSGHGDAMGAAGKADARETVTAGLPLDSPGDLAVVNPQKHGFRAIRIAMSWDRAGKGIDLDLGCLYELKSGERGAIQAFGRRFGDYNRAPFITLSGDERTGETPGDDEFLIINGRHWPAIRKILLYVYIYAGTPGWSSVRPLVHVRVPGEQPLEVIPALSDTRMPVCAVAGLENIRDGIRLTRHTEYFAGHAEMDRAFGYGINWRDGEKT